jgi:hypothetical protein
MFYLPLPELVGKDIVDLNEAAKIGQHPIYLQLLTSWAVRLPGSIRQEESQCHRQTTNLGHSDHWQ